MGRGGGGALVGHVHVLGGNSVMSLPGWLTLGSAGAVTVGGGVLVCRAA